MLFLFAIEPLACLIRQSPNLLGVSLGGEALLKVVMYADDTTFLLRDLQELRQAEMLLSTFEAGSGAKVNADKSELLPLGPRARAAPGSRFTLRPRDYTARLLGAPIGANQKDERCWETIMAKVDQLRRTWSGHGLSLRGKVLVCKTILLSQATFLLHVQAMPAKVSKKLDRMMALFIWGTARQEFGPPRGR